MRWARGGAPGVRWVAVVLVVTGWSPVACTGEAVGRDCLIVDVTTSPEKQRLMEDLADRFNQSDEARTDGGCVEVAVHTLSSGYAEQRLRQGWPDEDQDGPAPVIWTPASSSWAVLLAGHREQRLAAEPDLDPASIPVADENRSLARTPLVIAMPRSRAEALGWPDEEIGFADVLALAQADLEYPCQLDGLSVQLQPAVTEWCGDGPFTLGKTNPHVSTVGLAALIAQAHAATGQAVLTVDALDDPQVEAFSRGIESSVAHYGETTLTFLQSWFTDDQRDQSGYVDAIAVEEKSVIDYNRGDPAGLRLGPGETGERPHEPLVAMYPADGTFWSDNPAFVLDAEWVSRGEERAAERFVEFARTPESQRVVLDYGFRPVAESGVPAEGGLFSAEHGVDPTIDVRELGVPDGAVLDALLRQWDEQRRPARVLFVIDVSDSMDCPAHRQPRSPGCDAPADDAARSKLDVAQNALVGALLPADEPWGDGPLFTPDDVVGLWAFSTRMDESPVYGDAYRCRDPHLCEMVPPRPYGEVATNLRDAIAALQPQYGTPVYEAVTRAYGETHDHYDPARINAVVVLTDGGNNDEDDTDDRAQYEELIDMLGREEQAETPVRVFTIAYGADANHDELRAIAEASDAGFYDASDPRSLERTFVEVVSNF